MENVFVNMAKFHSMAYAYKAHNSDTVKNWNLRSWCEKASKRPDFIDLMKKCFNSLDKDFENNAAVFFFHTFYEIFKLTFFIIITLLSIFIVSVNKTLYSVQIDLRRGFVLHTVLLE